MRTLILLSLFILPFAFLGFKLQKCEHVFTSVVKPQIQIAHPSTTLGGRFYVEYSRPTGLQEGQELICVKCFHQQKQIVDHGEQTSYLYGTTLPIGTGWPCRNDSISKSIGWAGATLQCDTLIMPYGVNALNHLPSRVYKKLLDTAKK